LLDREVCGHDDVHVRGANIQRPQPPRSMGTNLSDGLIHHGNLARVKDHHWLLHRGMGTLKPLCIGSKARRAKRVVSAIH